MHARIARAATCSAALAAAVTGALTWAPAATARADEPSPAASAAPAQQTPAPDAGSIALTTKDPAGDPLTAASFLLLDTTGQQATRGETDAQGQLTFSGLAPGAYRLKETASGSPLHDAAADQDVIVTPGATNHLTITDPFKAAQVLVKAADDKTGKPLPGSTVHIGSGDTTLLTLTTGPHGTASGKLPMTSRKTRFWAKQTKAPAGYDLYKSAKPFTAGPGAPITVTVTNTKTPTTPTPTPSKTLPAKPTTTPSTPEGKPSENGTGGPKPAPTNTSTPDTNSPPVPAADPGDDASLKAPVGSLAHTGAEATPWIIGGAALFVAAGIVIVAITRHRTVAESAHDDSDETS
ncbi:SpaA isopeptide-forming pilin-related protein [Streptomyces sp. NPDC057654]|uniref:SpaA isopeptide-forming pilin-related protein n=1 Tax=Streptomyces sp. NPDC057654 TaxID=3346196 RepID=UPI0036B1E576